ncbi:glutathione S-transferase [Pannonibacter phragmitetus]|uniref:glutathione S-transferase family protein n=1 Tax=Pannonibacter phragmitetus TaxID=121719 RepID=UPI00067CF495|nr:glutathione S-transferase [Pannonibacter phragmitetus]KND20988.1 glutathione S-transferase [Pannonibacter phragmitetus]
MAEYVLHCFAQSGNAYKVALMLQLAGAEWEARFCDFFNGATRTPEFRAEVNEMGEIPVLEHKSLKLSQSGVILDYLAEELGEFGAHTENEAREILRWVLFDNHKLTSYTATLRFLRQFAKTGETPVTAFFEARAKSAYAILDKHLEGRRFVVADRPTTADLSLCGYLFWPEEIGIDFAPYSYIARWLDAIRALPGWVHPYELMPGHPLPAKA